VIRELSAAIMLFTSDTKVLSVLIFDLNESGDLGAIAVIGLIMLAVTFAVVTLINRIAGFGAARLRNPRVPLPDRIAGTGAPSPERQASSD
jgi:iron(III) transport system permease protein